jgi:NADH-quinone oxidoreductase subunit J
MAVETIIYICLGLMLVSGVLAVMFNSLIKSAIALAAASISLGIVLFELGAVWAALFEISVCSGLVTVIFVSAISLSNAEKKDIARQYEDKSRMKLLPFLLIAAGIGLVLAAALAGGLLPPVRPSSSAIDFREIFWNYRQADIWGQIIVVLAGATAVVVLFREKED